MLKYLFAILGLTFAPVLGVGTINLAIDPFHYFRDGPTLVDGIAPFRSERFINAGLVRHRDYDGLIIGTSMVQNFRGSQISALFKERIINLGMGGASLTEQAAVIRAAERRRPVKRIFWGLDQRSWVADPQAPINIEVFPLHLYQSETLPLITNYVLSKDVLALSLSGITKPSKPIDLDELYRWGAMGYNFSCATVKNNYLDGALALEGVPPATLHRNALAQVSATIEPIVRENPDTVFYLFIPPYSAAEYLRLTRSAPGMLPALEPFTGDLAKLAERYPNARVYDFRTRWEIVSNLNLFKDGLHYSPAINDWMAAYMAANDDLPSDGKFLSRVSALTEAQVFAQCPN